MPKKNIEELAHDGYTITAEQKRIIAAEAFARRYSGKSELVREIFQAWIDEFHKSSPSK
jgi:hypothetical protein